MKICLIYLDDVIIFSCTFEYVDRLTKVFQRIEEAGLKFAPTKFKLFHERVVYIGHTVFRNGIKTDPAKTETIKEWPTSQTPEDVCLFLGFTGNYRRKKTKDFAKIAVPLSALIPSPMKKQRGRNLKQQQKL